MSSIDETSRIRREFKKAVYAIKRDDVDALEDVLNVLPEFNIMVDEDGRNLLHLSCMFKKKKVFDYVLKLDDFDLEEINREEDYFPAKLLNTGANLYRIYAFKKEKYLHDAIRHNLLKIAELLLQRGVDPNAQDEKGRTPLHLLLMFSLTREVDEGVDLLLRYGADTAIRDNDGYLPFEYATYSKKFIREHLLYCTFDSHLEKKILFEFFIRTVRTSFFVNKRCLLDKVTEILTGDTLNFPVNFFAIPPDLLRNTIERCDTIIEAVFLTMEPDDSMAMNINNMEILLNSELNFETVELISRLQLSRIYVDNLDRMSQEELSTLILYLLTYGLNVTSCDCQKIYSSEGHSDLFKTMLLNLDYIDASRIYAPLVTIIADIHCDLNTIYGDYDLIFPALYSFSFYSDKNLLLEYFVNHELRLLYERFGEPDFVNKVRQLPTVPSLLQLARDETRRHIVRRYNLQKTSQYYWVLRRLFFGTIYEKILSFDTKLY